MIHLLALIFFFTVSGLALWRILKLEEQLNKCKKECVRYKVFIASHYFTKKGA